MVWQVVDYGSLKYWTSDLSFSGFWLLEDLQSRYFLMTLLTKNGGYAFSVRLDLIFSMSLWKEFQLLQILNDLSIKHLIKLILYENDLKLLKFKRSSVYVDLWYVWIVRLWLLISEMNAWKKAMELLICFSIVDLVLGCLSFKKFNKFNESCSLSKAARMSSTYLK